MTFEGSQSKVDPLPTTLFSGVNVSSGVSTKLLALDFDPHASSADAGSSSSGAEVQGGITEISFTDGEVALEALPNPQPPDVTLAWRANFSLDDPGTPYLSMAWEVASGAETCLEVFEAGEGAEGVVRVLRDLPAANTSCALSIQDDSSCYWDVDGQAFIGSGCILLPQMDCMCTHATDFGVAVERVELGARFDPPSIQDIWNIRNLLLICICLITGATLLSALATWDTEVERQKIVETLTTEACGFVCEPKTGAWAWRLTYSKQMLETSGSEESHTDPGMQVLKGGTLEILAGILGIPFMRFYLSLPLEALHGVSDDRFNQALQQAAQATPFLRSASMRRLRRYRSVKVGTGLGCCRVTPGGEPVSPSPDSARERDRMIQGTGRSAMTDSLNSLGEVQSDSEPVSPSENDPMVQGTGRSPTTDIRQLRKDDNWTINQNVQEDVEPVSPSETDPMIQGTGRVPVMESVTDVVEVKGLQASLKPTEAGKHTRLQSLHNMSANFGADYINGTALVLAFLCVRSLIPSHRLLRLLSDSEMLFADCRGINDYSFRELYSMFTVMADESLVQTGWYQRGIVWKAMFTQNDTGSWDNWDFSSTLASCLLADDQQNSPTFDNTNEFSWEVVKSSVPVELEPLAARVNTLEVWVTLLMVARLDEMNEMWAEPAGKGKGAQIVTLVDNAVFWLEAQARSDLRLAALMEDLETQAQHQAKLWRNQFLSVCKDKQRRQRDLRTEVSWRKRARGALRAAMRFFFTICRGHRTLQLFTVPPTHPLTRSMRIMLLLVLYYGSLTCCIWFFEQRGYNCCRRFRDALGCDSDPSAPCHGAEASCTQLHDMYQDESAAFQCTSFPDVHNTFHLFLLLFIPTVICKPLTKVLQMLFMMNSKVHVQVKWRRHSLLARVKAMVSGKAETLNWRRTSGLQSKRYNLYEEFLALSSNPIRYAMQKCGFGAELQGSERQNWKDARQAAKVKQQLKKWKRSAAERNLDDATRLQRGYTQVDVKEAKIAHVCESLAWAGCWVSLATFTYFIFVYGVAIYDNIEEGAQEEYVIEWLRNRCCDVLTSDFFRPLKKFILKSIGVIVLECLFHPNVQFNWLEVNWDAFSTGMVTDLSRILGDDAVLPGYFGDMDVDLVRDSVTGFD
ncbi:hypothetical protein CYMTET_6446 [Cymbomonas tetramitiformis]|uniref:Uncharacterized protein n=1 Tax=Cymbomonas tetramitiformis TaxID=36881 RepID=A0AAE0GXE7_9CHLO|nr:hypothetical protein CYMTET_6446 [Cymbomonas tetramitiformis]